MEALASRDDMLTSRLEATGKLSADLEDAGRSRVSLEIRCVQLEEAKDRWEGERLEAEQRLQTEREFSKEALKPLDDLQAKHDQLQKEFIAWTELSQKNV